MAFTSSSATPRAARRSAGSSRANCICCDRASRLRATSPPSRSASASLATGLPRPRCPYSSPPPAGGRRCAGGAKPGRRPREFGRAERGSAKAHRAPFTFVMPAGAGIHNRGGNGDISRVPDSRVRRDDRSLPVVNICSTQCDMSQEFSPADRWRSSAYGELTFVRKRQMRSWDTRRRRGVAAARPRHGRRLKAAADRRSRQRAGSFVSPNREFFCSNRALLHRNRKFARP